MSNHVLSDNLAGRGPLEWLNAPVTMLQVISQTSQTDLSLRGGLMLLVLVLEFVWQLEKRRRNMILQFLRLFGTWLYRTYPHFSHPLIPTMRRYHQLVLVVFVCMRVYIITRSIILKITLGKFQEVLWNR